MLGPDGPLAKRVTGFVARRAQQEMAERIEQTLNDSAVFIAESGTGTGKTYAYLVPALLSGKKVLISTGTKNLQDQLFKRDLPAVRDALEIPVSIALLKGRANYLCLERLERTELEASFAHRRPARDLIRIREWAGVTRSGDVAELPDVPEDSEWWPRVTSTSDNCLGSGCRYYDDCHVHRARREALAADIVVINHHLFFADLVLKEEGFGQLLPGVEAVIFDEAHQLPEVASNFFGVSISSQQLYHLMRDTLAEELKEHSAVGGLSEAAGKLEKATADLRLALGGEVRRAPWESLNDLPAFGAALDELRARLASLVDLLEHAAAKGTGLANCFRRAMDLLDRLIFITDRPDSDYVAWYETSARQFALRLTPMDVARPFRTYLEDGPKAWIFTSATLAVDGDFSHFQTQLGLEHATTGLWGSPFDFAHRTLLYLPPDLPAPASPDYTDRVLDAAVPILQASRGRAFILFTSHRALRRAAESLPSRVPYPILVQGSAPRAALLEQFRAAGDAVLLGTSSFWEGVDVRGEALSTVIIDKLPFATPDDPVLRARAQALEAAGRSPFMEYQLPQAVIALKQGVGRLIRDERDRGVLVLCDPRLLSKAYGRIFLTSLPPMPRCHDVTEVERFFAHDSVATVQA